MAEPLASERVTVLSSTATLPTVNTAPSAAVTAKRAGWGRRPAVSSSASSKTMAIDVPAAGTLADCGAGPAMSAVVASSALEAGPRPELLMANTR